MDTHGHVSSAQSVPPAGPHPPRSPRPRGAGKAAHAALRAAVPVAVPPAPAPRPRRRKPKRTRGNAAHPGVVLLPPHGRHGWRARYRDPISGRRRKVTLSPVDAASVATRTAWAVAMSELIQRTIRDRALGVRAPLDVTVADAIERWMAADARTTNTVKGYRTAVREFTAYVGAARFVREIDPPLLEAFRAHVRARKCAAGQRRGQPLKLAVLNTRFRTLIAFLRWARRGAGCVLATDDIAHAFRAFRVKHERKPFMTRAAIERLLELANKHEPQLYWPIRTGLLTGLRAAELVSLRWEWITEGDRIQLRAAAAKGAIRDIDLTVTHHAIPPRRPGTTAGKVYPELTYDRLQQGIKRLRDRDPDVLAGVTAHALRRTCATYFTCTLNPWRSAKSLGHTVAIAERHYAGLVRVPPGCATLEAAMGIEGVL